MNSGCSQLARGEGDSAGHRDGALAGILGSERFVFDGSLQGLLPDQLVGAGLAELAGFVGLVLQVLQVPVILLEHGHGLAVTPLKEISDALHSADEGGDVAEAYGITPGKVGHDFTKGLMVEPAFGAVAAWHGVEIHAGVQEGSQGAGVALTRDRDEIRMGAILGVAGSVGPAPANDVAADQDIGVVRGDCSTVELEVVVGSHLALSSGGVGGSVEGSMLLGHDLRVNTYSR